MKMLLLFALLALPAWPNACTLSTSRNLSASGGHWTGTGCTGGSYIPAAPDTVTLADGVTLTEDQNWTIGASGASATTPAISSATTGQLVVNGGYTLTLRGDYLESGGGAVPFLTMNAGSSLVFDSSASVSPTTTRYRAGTTANYNYRSVVFSGTSASHVSVTSNVTGGALAGWFGFAGYGLMNMVGTYVDFSYIGDAASWAFVFDADPGYTGTTSLQHFTCNYCGYMYLNVNSSTATFLLNYGLWTNTLATTDLAVAAMSAPTTGSYTFQHLSFDLEYDQMGGCSGLGTQAGLVFIDDYFQSGMCLGSTFGTFSDVFYRNPDITNVLVMTGSVNGLYYLADVTGGAEFHFTQPSNSGSATYQGIIVDQPDDSTAQQGFMFLPVTSGTAAVTHTYNNNIELPSRGGSGSNSLDACTNALPPSGNNETANLSHNTWIGWNPDDPFDAGLFAMVTVDEGGACIAPAFNQLLSTMMWSNGGQYYKTNVIQTSSLSTNIITTADYNVSDSSAHLQATNLACSGCTNQGKGYAAKWTATPGAHDFFAPPYFADVTRNVATFDTGYLHHAAGTQWMTSTSYTVGQVVSDPQSTVYGGAIINYRCIAAHTSSPTTEPNVGASWRTDWELASLSDIRIATAAGTVYTDWAIGCSAGCTAIQAVEGWTKRGFTPQNPALWCSGHDGEAVGAVPFCATGKVLLGVISGM